MNAFLLNGLNLNAFNNHQVGELAFLAVMLLIALANWLSVPRLGRKRSSTPDAAGRPRVSVLVPARDEEANIGPCVGSLLAQDYPNFEVLVMDDHSQDRTPQILAELAAGDARLRVLNGAALPPGWLGKHWACQQLSAAAGGELLLFVDADTRHHPQTLCAAVAELQAGRADLLTALPYQELDSWGERLTVPVLYFSMLGLLPMALAERVRLPALSAAIGQFMLFRREAYERVGGFAAVRQQAADDLALARRVKAAGLRWRLANAADRVSCRMYHSFPEALRGIGRGLLAAFGYRVLPFVFAWLWIGLIFLEPFGVLAAAVPAAATGAALPAATLALAGLMLLAGLLIWVAISGQARLPGTVVLLYPLVVALGVVMAGLSLVLTLAGQATWKGRSLQPPRIRLI